MQRAVAHEIFLLIVFSLSFCSGCVIPVAAFPVPCVASGQRLEFLDEDGQPIRADGLLVTRRLREFRVFFGRSAYASSTRVAAITSGTTNLPDEWVVAVFALIPNEIAIGYGLGSIMRGHIEALPLLPLLTIPLPVVFPWEEIFVVPLVPGYHQLDWAGYKHASANTWLFYYNARISNDPPVLRKNSSSLLTAKNYWSGVLRGLRHSRQKPRFDERKDFVLNIRDYRRAKALVLIELRSIARQFAHLGLSAKARGELEDARNHWSTARAVYLRTGWGHKARMLDHWLNSLGPAASQRKPCRECGHDFTSCVCPEYGVRIETSPVSSGG